MMTAIGQAVVLATITMSACGNARKNRIPFNTEVTRQTQWMSD